MTDDTSPRPISPTKMTGRPKDYQQPEELNEFPPYTHPLQPQQPTHQNSVYAVPVNNVFSPEPVVHSYVPYNIPDGTNFVVQQNATVTSYAPPAYGAYYQEQVSCFASRVNVD